MLDRESIDILAKANVLSAAAALKLEGIAGFRNILVHEYIDRDIVYQYLQQGVDDLQMFAQEIVRFMRLHPGDQGNRYQRSMFEQ